jgi:aspartate/methionine/tyrosine aminotransferase
MRASDRVTAIPRSGIRAVIERAGRPGVVSLAAGDPDFATPPHIVEAAVAALERGETHYTHGRGLIELREAHAAKLAAENAITADPGSEIVVTAGALDALAAVFLSVVDTGDRVILPDPGFANYVAQVLLAGGVPVALPHRHADDFQPDLVELERLAATARVLVVNTPSNPTGAVLGREMLTAIADIAVRHDLLVISDEAYEHLVYDGAEHVSIGSLPGMAERTVTIGSLSKSWAMTGWRIGFAVGPASVIEAVAKVQEHLIGCPPAMTQWGAVAALTGPTEERDRMVARYSARRNAVIAAFAGLPDVELVAPAGAFYAFPRFDLGVHGDELAALVADGSGVVAVPGSAFGENGADHLRLCFAVPDETLALALDKLTGWLASRARKGLIA